MPETGSIKPRVLVVTHERPIADALAMILNRSGFQACGVYSGEEAVEKAPQFKPDMLYSQVCMYGMNGIDAAIRILQMLPSIRILLFDGSARSVDFLEQARAQGYDFEILASPVHPQDLLSKLRADFGMTAPVSRPET
jgi:CheY-like chemotaxis protein